MKRKGAWQDATGVVHQETGSLLAAVGGWAMLMWCGAEAPYDPSYRFTKRTVDCMTCLVKGAT
jgi:hypothetical protein